MWPRACRGHKFSGDIKGLVSVEKAEKAPFLLAYKSRFLYPVNALHAKGLKAVISAGQPKHDPCRSGPFPVPIMIEPLEL